MHRLFVALRPPIAIRQSLTDVMDDIAGARWQDDEQLHITLRYIGKVERPMAEDVAIALETVRASPLSIAISGVGMFEDHGHVRAVWAGVSPRDAITALHRKIDQALIRIGLAPEGRTYHPHVTLARMGKSAGAVDPFLHDRATLTLPPFVADHFLLYESHIDPGGATYEPVARYPMLG